MDIDIIDFAIVALPCIFFWYIGGVKSAFDIIKTRYERFSNLQRIISVKHKSSAMILYASLYIVLQSVLYTLVQKLNKTVVRKDKHYEITYYIGGQKYVLTVPTKRGPCPILSVTGDDYTDLTDEVIQYLGPCNDFHNRPYTPAWFGCKTMSIELDDYTKLDFYENDILKI